MEENDLLTNPRDARALVYHARRVNGGQRANGTGKAVEELCVELGVHFDWVRSEPRGVKNLRKKLTKELSPEKLLLLLSSLQSWKKVQITHLCYYPQVESEISNLLSSSFSNLRRLRHLDLCSVTDREETQFLLAPHARQLGDALKNLPLKYLRLWSVLRECAVAIRLVVESDNCQLNFLAWKDRYIPGENIHDRWCASMEESTSAVTACGNVETLRELRVGRFVDGDTIRNLNLRRLQAVGQQEPCSGFFDKLGGILKCTKNAIEILHLQVDSRVGLIGLIDGLEGNPTLRELVISDRRRMACIGTHALEMEALHNVMQDNLAMKMLVIDRLGVDTRLPYNHCVTKWLQRSRLSAETRLYHQSIHFFCVFNQLGRAEFVRGIQKRDDLPLVNPPKADELIKTIALAHSYSCELRLSAVYELLRANPVIIHQSSLPPTDTVARRAIHYNRGCKRFLGVRGRKRCCVELS